MSETRFEIGADAAGQFYVLRTVGEPIGPFPSADAAETARVEMQAAIEQAHQLRGSH